MFLHQAVFGQKKKKDFPHAFWYCWNQQGYRVTVIRRHHA